MDEHLFVGEQTHFRFVSTTANNVRNNLDDRINLNRQRRRHQNDTQQQRRRLRADDDDDRTQEFIHLENPRPNILRENNLYVDVNNVTTSTLPSTSPPTFNNNRNVDRRVPIHLNERTRVNNNNSAFNHRRVNTGINSSTNNNNNNDDIDDDSDSSAFVAHRRRRRSDAPIIIDSSPFYAVKFFNDPSREHRTKNHSSTTNDGDLCKLPPTRTPGRSVRLITTPTTTSTVITEQPKKLNDGHRTNLPTLICRECNKCRCQACMTPKIFPSKYLCNRRCLCSTENVVDCLSCFKAVKCCWYHLDSLDDDDEDYADRCRRDDERTCKCLPSTSTSNCLMKGTCLAASLILLPCLWCYPALRLCSWICTKCYSRYHDNGCRCNPRQRMQYAPPTSTTTSQQTKILPPPFNLRTTSLDGLTTTTAICSQPTTTTTDRHFLKLHEPP